MLKKVYMVFGFALGALFVWSLLHDARKRAQLWSEEEEAMRKLGDEWRMRDAMEEAITGKKPTRYEDIKDELAKYENPDWDEEDY